VSEQDEVVALLGSVRSVAVTSHLAPDGDGLGSGLALVRALKSVGVAARFVSTDGVPRRYRFLPGADDVLRAAALVEPYDAVILIECPERHRPGLSDLDRYRLVNIDHHALNARYAAINWVDPRAAAVGEMIYDLLPALGVALDRDIAVNLYTAIVTDTGSFRYSNTTHRTFEIAAALLSAGCQPAAVATALYEDEPLARLELTRKALGSLVLDPSGRLAWIELDAADVAWSLAHDVDTEDLVNYPRSIAGVEVALFFKDRGHGPVKVSLRSRGRVDVAAFAARFGGGGHKQAAGCSITGKLDEVRDRVLAMLREELGATAGPGPA